MTRAQDEAAVAALVDRVRRVTGHDLHGYRTDGLVRRARQRAAVVGAESLAEYLPTVDEAEARSLLDHVLVQVSGWFRDPYAWESLRATVLPGMAARRGGPVPLQVWVAGCGQGQEVWSLAACLAEAVDRGHLSSWRLLASDVDGQALSDVERAVYPAAPLPEVGRQVLPFHVHEAGGRWRVASSLTAHVRTVRHDVRDAPPEELDGPADLVVCRNVLMYLDRSTQLRVLDGLVASVRPGGVVLLGHAEMPLDRRDALVPVDLAARAYRSIASSLPAV